MNSCINTEPIGIFDSGVGGLSVLMHIRKRLPHENILYVADSHYAPYGTKSSEFIQGRARLLTEFLISSGAKCIVVACNTATAAAVQQLRKEYSLPIIGMEPAVKPAAAASRNGIIGVLATSGTLKSAQFAALLATYGHHVEVVTQACSGLVECVERGELKAQSTLDLLRQYLLPLLQAKADTIVLGCTHYPFLRPAIDQVLAELRGEELSQEISIIDTGDAVAKHLVTRLQQSNLLSSNSEAGEVKFWTSSQSGQLASTMKMLCQSPLEMNIKPC